MQILYHKNYNPAFSSTMRTFRTKNGKEIGNDTYLFRDDIDWKQFSKYETEHFKDKNKVNIIQFASSDGSEAYTQVMAILTRDKTKAEKFFPIHAYDIDKEMVKSSKSGFLNITLQDINRMRGHSIDYKKYFKIPAPQYRTMETLESMCAYMSYPELLESVPRVYSVSEDLTKRVKFYQNDMFKILKNLKDNSNTILMCRNILGYFSNNEIYKFITLLSQKLKSNSLFVIGSFDSNNSNIEKYLKQNGFQYVFKNVYKKI